jgi:aspartate 1-decarboxylase
VEIYNVTNGNRFSTYAITAGRGSGTVSVNGAAAHLAEAGDIVIIASYSVLTEQEAQRHSPVLVYVDEKNSVKRVGSQIAQAL